jgi:pyrophosphatase PpaX
MSPFKAVLFDYDDTLCDTFSARIKAAEVAAEGVLDSSVDLDQVMKDWAGRPQIDIWTDLVGDRETAQKMWTDYQRWYWRNGTKSVRLFDGIEEMLGRLKDQGVLLGIVTSKAKLLENEDGPYGVVVEMQRLGVLDLFDCVVGWGDVEESKPKPAPILFALDKLDITSAEALMVGDSHIDITAAKNADVTSAGALWGATAKELLVQSEPDYLLETPAQVCGLV